MVPMTQEHPYMFRIHRINRMRHVLSDTPYLYCHAAKSERYVDLAITP